MKKRMKRQSFLKLYDMSYSTFERFRHRWKDPLPCMKIGRIVYVDMEKYPEWEMREAARQEAI